MKKNDIKSKMARNQARLNKKKINETGEGLFLYRNKSTTASIQLFKKSVEGKLWIEPGQTWTGDSSFLKMVPREASLVKTIENPQKNKQIIKENVEENTEKKIESQKVNKEVTKKKSRKKNIKEKNMNEEKLLLDQPDQISTEGTLEHVVKPSTKQTKKVKKNEQNENTEDALLTEDPLSGVTIINE